MTTIEEIKIAIAHLSDEDLRKLRAWYEEFDAKRWDDQLVDDITTGRLDELADAAVQAFYAGKTTEL